MKRFPIFGILMLIPAILLVGAVGCTSKPDKTTAAKSPTTEDRTTKAAVKKEIETALEATVTGTVKFKGKAPEMKPIAKMDDNSDYKTVCSKGETVDQTWHVAADGAVADVIVILAPPEGMKFKIDDKLKGLSKKTVEIDQPFCQYVPHIAGLFSGVQTLKAKNTSTVNHNVKIDGVANPTVAPGKDTGDLEVTGNDETLLSAGCSIHGWMSAKIAVFRHPYFAVTDAKGNFEIKNVPIDTKLKVYIWHESLGDLKAKVEKAEKSFTKGGNSLGELEISAK